MIGLLSYMRKIGYISEQFHNVFWIAVLLILATFSTPSYSDMMLKSGTYFCDLPTYRDKSKGKFCFKETGETYECIGIKAELDEQGLRLGRMNYVTIYQLENHSAEENFQIEGRLYALKVEGYKTPYPSLISVGADIEDENIIHLYQLHEIFSHFTPRFEWMLKTSYFKCQFLD